MTSNPYISQHYGSSMDMMAGGHDVDEVNAAVGFRRFPNAAHMTHTVFRPKNAPAVVANAPQSSALANRPGLNEGGKAEAPDALASIRQHRGVPIDNFPSRPQTPKGNSSALPPLLPTDRSSAGSSESLRDRGAGLLRSWVKAATTASSSSSSASSPSTSPRNNTAAAAVVAAPSATEALQRRGLKASPPPLPVTAVASPPHLQTTAAPPSPPPPSSSSPAAVVGPSADAAAASVSISPMSPNLGSNAKTTPANETPIPTPEPEGASMSMDAMLQRSRAALEHVQRVLGEAPAAASTSARALAPPPPLTTERVVATAAAGPRASGWPYTAVDAGVSSPSGERSPENSLDYLSPISVQHTESRGFHSPTSKPNGVVQASEFGALERREEKKTREAVAVAVPDVTRYMVLCPVQDPAKMAAMRRRRRCPGGSHDTGVEEGSGTPGLSPSATGRHQHGAQTRRIAEVVHPCSDPPPVAEAAAAVVVKTTAAPLMSLPASPSASSSSLHAALAATQPRQRSPPSSPTTTAAAPAVSKRPSRAPHDDPSLLQELADFLRAGNGQGFSALSAALTMQRKATAAPAATPARAVSPRAQAQRRRSAPPPAPPAAAAAAPPPPTVLMGHPPTSSPSALFNLSFTPSSELARVQPHDAAAGGFAVPHAASARPQRPGALPSYAQPTISWLSKGSEASADDFPVTTPSSETRAV